ncbi:MULTISPECIES: site-2 protease family protein [Herbaspirillum]|uniref:Zn-dependent protease protein n=1 Tax=Herbaspirillum seropedicae (strain SmR1) TaxID=757424 RepID=D8J1X6_HERSS|nr:MULTISPECIES: site-2 protease family protein [Herbaspirillum]ADJ64759.1 Zn-dependent protease protein [Herbaspirillum seropedicae SmR1]AKN66666.1 peptidase M50 [Herbaspirillum seropedicae]AON55533.1 Zn-dependent protease [Herbaspirillum seropedicae]MDR6397383.1 Zn-dependent protease [Herbaspirillum seropedicae]NQE28345.1 peptidase M50 [Herbaspirillum seropedicae]
MNDLIQTVAVYALPVLFAITLHEAAHAYAAKFFGDNTAYSMGRMSLNPIKHIDPFGTILIPILLYFATSGAFLFGYAKPVPINFGHLRKPKRDMAWVSLAGPAANFFMALLWTLTIYALALGGVQEEFFMLMAKAGVLTNLVMFAFNLFPIPPLDGGRILTSLLPNRYAYKFAQIEPYGFFIVMALVLAKVIYTWWMAPVMYGASLLLQLITYPITLLFQ